MKSKMMRYSIMGVMLACMAGSGNLYALKAPEGTGVPTSTESSGEKPEAPVKQRPREAKKPAGNFKPSEKVGADSAVSFPVDI